MVIIVILYLQDIDVNVMLTILILYPRISVSAEALMTIITEVCKAPTHWLKGLNRHNRHNVHRDGECYP